MTTRFDKTAAALDLGTTTVSAALIDIDTGRVIDTVSHLNPQRIFGADVLSRITACAEGKTEKLFARINSLTENILRGFTEKFSLENTERLVVAGNTVMSHLFVGESAAGMGEYPFTPKFLSARRFTGKELGLSVGNVFLFPSVSAFIGGDVTAGIYATELFNAEFPSMLVDMGTNGEIALKANGKLYFCSVAAGPALEGAEISCGVGGIAGAINKVWSERGRIEYSTVDDASPIGICGAGLVDAVAALLTCGELDATGAFVSESSRKNGFTVADNVTLTAKDIRKFQVAKSAMVTGIRSLCSAAGIKLSDIKKVYAAGGLGFYLNERNAVYTGLLPKEFIGKTVACGNTSLEGCIKFIARKNENCDFFGNVSEKIVLDLANDPKFNDEFIDNTALGLI